MIVGRYVGSASKGNQEFASSAQKHRCRTCSEGRKGIERAFPDKARDRQGKSDTAQESKPRKQEFKRTAAFVNATAWNRGGHPKGKTSGKEVWS